MGHGESEPYGLPGTVLTHNLIEGFKRVRVAEGQVLQDTRPVKLFLGKWLQLSQSVICGERSDAALYRAQKESQRNPPNQVALLRSANCEMRHIEP